MKLIWTYNKNFIFVFSLALLGSVHSQWCSHKGFITSGSNDREFRVCSKDEDGGLSIKTFMCGENSVFSSEKKRCVLGVSIFDDTSTDIKASPTFDELKTSTTSRPLRNDDRETLFNIEFELNPTKLNPTTRRPLMKEASLDGREIFYQYRNRGYNPPSTTSQRTPQIRTTQMVRHLAQPLAPVHSHFNRNNGVSKYNDHDKECPIATGRFCHTCTTLVSCINYRVVSVEHCLGCSPYLRMCTNEFIPECVHENNFVCTSFGLFPDPYFCSRYHLCRGPDLPSYYFHCEPGMIFDPYLEECRVDPSGKYHYYMPCPSFRKCEEDFQVGSMRENPQFYYVCLEDKDEILRRTLYKCPKNKVFNGTECIYNH